MLSFFLSGLLIAVALLIIICGTNFINNIKEKRYFAMAFSFFVVIVSSIIMIAPISIPIKAVLRGILVGSFAPVLIGWGIEIIHDNGKNAIYLIVSGMIIIIGSRFSPIWIGVEKALWYTPIYYLLTAVVIICLERKALNHVIMYSMASFIMLALRIILSSWTARFFLSIFTN